MNKDNLQSIIDYMYEDEKLHLRNSLKDTSQEDLPEDIDEAIRFLEECEYTSHIAYHLMVLKKEIDDSNNRL